MVRNIFALFAFLICSGAQASNNFDGCFQLYLPNEMYPAICIDGSNEEGIAGSGTRLYIFATNTSEIVGCASSSSISLMENTFSFKRQGNSDLILSEVTGENGSLRGSALVGKSSVKFIQIDPSTSERLRDKTSQDLRCKNLAAGELRSFPAK